MNTNGTDHKFRQLFNELKHHDAPTAPPFARLTRPPARPAPTAVWWWLAPATAALAIGVVSLSLVHQRQRRVTYDARQWAALSTWETPTDALLDVSSWTASAASVSDTTAVNQKEITP